MPTVIPNPTPSWLKPENASVLDPAYRAPLRKIVEWLGLADPQQIVGIGVPLETGAMTGGVLDALAARLPRFAKAIKAYRGQTSLLYSPEIESGRFPGLVFSSPSQTVASLYAEGVNGSVTPLSIRAARPLDLRSASALQGSGEIRQAIGKALGVDLRFDADIAPALRSAGYDAVHYREFIPGRQTAEETIASLPEATHQVNTIKAYHGSPHDFEAFDSAKIGTGEGAQAYGHGLYFAEKEGTAQSYKDILQNRRFNIGGREITSATAGTTRALEGQSMAENIAAGALDDAINAQSTSPAQFAANRLRYQRRIYPEQAADIDEAMNVIAEWQRTGEKHAKTGKTYEVAIKADPEQFLDWDKPLSQQSDTVRRTLETSRPEWSGRIVQQPTDPNAGEIVQALRREGDPEHGFRQAGIPGIKYLDQGSRAAGEGSRNYVVFDAATIEILRKYGILLPMAAGLGSQYELTRGGSVP